MGAAQHLEPRGPSSGARLRLLSSFAALAAGATAVVLVALILRDLPPVASTSRGASSTATSAATPSVAPTVQAPTRFPAPPRGSVVFAAQAGVDVLGLAVVPGKNHVVVQASMVGQQGNGVRNLTIAFHVTAPNGRRTTSAASPCGAGCYRARIAVPRPRSVAVSIGAGKPISFAMTSAWPPRPAAALVAGARNAWLGLHTLVIDDSYGDGNVTLHTLWQVVAPDRIADQIRGGGDSIIIGDRRWDRPSGSNSWIGAAQSPVQQPQPFWVSAVDAHLLGSVSLHGRPAWKVSFFDPKTPGWYTLLIDKATMHTMDMRMLAQAHFMHDTYSSFDAPIAILPPK
jgi:hypothetical protein